MMELDSISRDEIEIILLYRFLKAEKSDEIFHILLLAMCTTDLFHAQMIRLQESQSSKHLGREADFRRLMTKSIPGLSEALKSLRQIDRPSIKHQSLPKEISKNCEDFLKSNFNMATAPDIAFMLKIFGFPRSDSKTSRKVKKLKLKLPDNYKGITSFKIVSTIK